MDTEIIKDVVYKKGRKTSEMAVTGVGGFLAALVALGVVDISPEGISEISANVVEGVGIAKNVVDGNGSVMESLFRIVGLIVGGHIATTYIKSRSDVKTGNKQLNMVRDLMAEIQKMKSETSTEILNENEKDNKEPSVTV